MSIPGSASPLLFASVAAAPAGYQIERSLRFNSSDSAYLSRTPASAGNRKTWTWAGWVKRPVLNSGSLWLCNYDINGYNGFNAGFTPAFGSVPADIIRIVELGGSTPFDTQLVTTQVFRDPSAWYHVVIAYDTTQATASNRVKLYVNGLQITQFSTATYPSQNFDGYVNKAEAYYIGKVGAIAGYHNDYLADIHFIDGQALDPSSFGEPDDNGVWQPIEYAGTYGTNGFHLPFSNNSTAAALGTDTSGNGNDWTPNNVSVELGGPTSVAAASGALPIYNTTDTYGTVKGTGTRTDTNSASIILAIPMDGTNNGTTFTDESATIKGSGSAKSITRNGAVTSTTQSKFYGSSGFFDGTDDYLTTPDDNDFTLGSGDFTIEFFINPSATASKGLFGIIGSGASTGSTAFYAQLTSTNTLFFSAGDGSGETNFTSTAVFTAGTWNHGAIVRNGNTVNFYFSGVLDKSISFTRTIANQSTPFTLGRVGDYVGAGYYNGYIQDFRIYKGVAKYTSNFNPPSATRIESVAAANDSLVDSPTNYGTDTGAGGEVRGNYATLNPLNKGANCTLTNGNLDWASNSTTAMLAQSTIAMSSGKWYCEFTATTTDNMFGLQRAAGTVATSFVGGNTDSWGYYANNGNKYTNSSASAYGASYTTNDVIGVAFDADAGTLTFYKNGVSQGQAFSGLTNGPYTFALGNGTATNNVPSAVFNAGARPFAYTAPSGFKALCTTNLPEPTIADGSTVMDVALYTGNGSTQTISGLNFSPDLVWIKSRSSAYSHALFDVVRGATKQLSSDNTSAEATYVNSFTAFNSDGFSVGSDAIVNNSSSTFAAWTWDAGSSTVTNTQGSITSTVRANASAGFSVVTFTGNGTQNATVGHGLGVAPVLHIIKNRSSSSNWVALTTSINGSLDYAYLNSTAAFGNAAQNTPTSSVFSVWNDTDSNANGSNYVAYCFAPVDGYSSFGSYTGNGSADGPFVYTGFRPRWVMVKLSSSSGENWVIMDAARSDANLADDILWANLSNAEFGNYGQGFDFTSNGFKIRGTWSGNNTSAATYIYAAFAESPFAYARAR